MINLDDRTFESLVEEAKKQIPIYAPHWTDHNVHDPGITLIELFAWLTEMQIYQLNKVTDENKWTFLALMGIKKDAGHGNGNESINLETSILQARKDLHTVYRAVTSADYETLILEAAGLNAVRARALPRYHPILHQDVPGIVTIVVVPASEQDKNNTFLGKVYLHIDRFRPLTTEVFVVFPFYTEVGVHAQISVKPRYLERTVIDKVKTRLTEFFDPVAGGPDSSGWPFGRPVYRSEIFQVIDNVDGVDHVNQLKLNNSDGDIVIPKHGLVQSGTHKINEDAND